LITDVGTLVLYHSTRLPTRPDSSLRYRRYINHLLTYLLTYLLTLKSQKWQVFLVTLYSIANNVMCVSNSLCH